MDEHARTSSYSAQERSGGRRRVEAANGQMRPGEAGSYAVRAGRARTCREKRTDHRRRPGLGHSDLSPEKHSREVTSLRAMSYPERIEGSRKIISITRVARSVIHHPP